MRRLIVVVLVGLLFVGFAACGGGDDKDSAEDISADSAKDDDGSGSADDSDASDDSSDSSDDSDSDSSSGASAAALFSSQDCVQAVQAISAAYSMAGLAMAGQTDEIEKSEKEFEAFAKKAPKDIQGDIDTLQDAYGEYGRVIRTSGWKPEDGAPPQSVIDKLEEASKKLESDEVKTAGDHIETWLKDECGS